MAEPAAVAPRSKRSSTEPPNQNSGLKRVKTDLVVHRPNVRSTPFEFGYHLRPYPWEVNTIPPPGKLWESKAKKQTLVSYNCKDVIKIPSPLPIDEKAVLHPLLPNDKPEIQYIPTSILSQGGQGAIVLYEEQLASIRQPTTLPPTVVAGKLNYRVGVFSAGLLAVFDDGEYFGGPDEEEYVDFAEIFRDEVVANELLRMTGTSHVVRMIGYPEHADSYFLMEYVSGGTLAEYRHQWTLLELWHLFECLAKAVAVMAWGSEYPDFRVKDWQQIIHLDLVPDNVFVASEGDHYHSCGSHRCFKIGDFGLSILWPIGDVVRNPYENPDAPGLINHYRKQLVAIESNDRKYTGRGKARPPEQTHANPAFKPKDDTNDIAHNYSWWTNVWQIGTIICNLNFRDPETGKSLDDIDLNDDVLSARLDGDQPPQPLLTHMQQTAHFRNTRRPDAALSRARLARLVKACTETRPRDRIDIPGLLLEITKGIAEASPPASSSSGCGALASGNPEKQHLPVQWEADMQDQFLLLTRERVKAAMKSGWGPAIKLAKQARKEIVRALEEIGVVEEGVDEDGEGEGEGLEVKREKDEGKKVKWADDQEEDTKKG